MANRGKASTSPPKTRSKPVPPKAAEFEGALTKANDSTISGWVRDPSRPETRLEVEILVDGERLAVTVADRLRPELLEAGVGDGRYGFKIQLDDRFKDGRRHEVRARVSATGRDIDRSPRAFGEPPQQQALPPQPAAAVKAAPVYVDLSAADRLLIDGMFAYGGAAEAPPLKTIRSVLGRSPLESVRNDVSADELARDWADRRALRGSPVSLWLDVEGADVAAMQATFVSWALQAAAPPPAA